MTFTKLAVATLLLLSNSVVANRDVHPVTNVITLLQGLKATAEAEGKAEEVTYTKFVYWCTNSKKTLDKAIAEEKATIEELEEKIDGLEKQSALLLSQIAELANVISEQEAAGRTALRLRNHEATAYTRADGDYVTTVQAIQNALDAMTTAYATTDPSLLQSGEMAGVARGKLLEALTLGLPAASNESQRSEIDSLVQLISDSANNTNYTPNADITRPDLLASGDYAAHIDNYDFKSHRVIELLKDLKLKFEDEKLAATKAETNSLDAYTLAKDARDDIISKARAAKLAKELAKSIIDGDIITLGNDLTSERADLLADEGTLASTTKACNVKAAEYAERVQIRAREQEAIEEAIKILAKVTGVRTEAPSNPVPPPSPVTLVQVGSDDPKMRAVQLLRESARKTHSKSLERLAQEISTHLNGKHFDEVINMVQKMIFRLMQEQKDEDDHKNWCDLELEKTEASRVNKWDKMEELRLAINAAQGKIGLLSTEIQADLEMVATIEGHMADSQEIRNVGKEENKIAVKDAQAAQDAIANAIAVLQTFYKDTGMVAKESWEFMQLPVQLPVEPATWGASYTGVADPTNQPTGIVTLLKAVAADFSEMEANTNAQEVQDQDLHEEEMKECAIEKARRAKEAEMKTNEKQRLADQINSDTAQRNGISKQHDAVVQYNKDLQHACVDSDSTYVDRVAARNAEIDALKEAQGILMNAFSAPAPAPALPTFLARKMRGATGLLSPDSKA